MTSPKILLTLSITMLCLFFTACDSQQEREAKYIERGDKFFEQGSYAKARVEYKNAARINPTDPKVRYSLGLVDEIEGNLQNAMTNFLTAERQDGHFEPAVFKLAQYFLAAGQMEESRKRLNLLLIDNPNNAQAHALLGSAFLHDKDFAMAEKEVRRAFDIDPDNIIGFSVLTGLYANQNEPEKALATIEDGIRRNPKELALLLLKATLHAEKNDWAQIKATYQKIFVLRPNDVSYRLDLAEIFTKAEQDAEAEIILREAVAAFPDRLDVKGKLIAFLSQHRDLATAEAEIRAYIKTDATQSELYLWLADLYVQHDAMDRAVALLEDLAGKDKLDDMGLNARTSLARLRLMQGDRRATQKLVDFVLAKAPDNNEALFVRARLAYDDGDYQKAVSDLRTILRNSPRAAKPLLVLAETFVAQGRVELAIDTLNQLQDIDPQDLKARTRLAQLYAVQGDNRRAQELLNLVTQMDATYPVAWESLARTAISGKDWDAARQAIEKLKTIEGQTLTAAFLQGQVQTETGHKAEAVALYKHVIEADPSAPLAEHALAALIAQAKADSQLEDIAAYIPTLKTDSVFFISAYGEVLLELGKTDEAEAALDKAIRNNTPLQAPYLNLARLQLNKKQVDTALATLRQAAQAIPSDPRAALMEADILITEKRHGEAIAAYDALLTRNPDLDVAANNMAQLVADHQSNDAAALDKARVLAERFAKAQNPYFLDTLGWIYVRQGQLAQALPIYERVFTLMNNAAIPQMEYHYGSLLFKMGQPEGAKAHLVKAVGDVAPYVGIDEARALLEQTK